jgi:hypothetical protein
MKYSLLLLMTICGLSQPALGATKVTGRIDGFHPDPGGVPVLYGWACSVGSASSIQIDLYMNQGYPAGHLIGRFTANQASEAAVAEACGADGKSYRFAISLTNVIAGVSVYAYGISETGQIGPPLSGSGDARVPANAKGTPFPGSVSTGKQFVLYDASVDASSGCAPYLDSPIYPLSFPSANHQDFELWLNVVSPANDGNNYWVKGRMNSVGAETSPLRVNCSPILSSPHDPDSARYSGSQWLIGFFKHSDGDLYGIVHNEFYGGDFPQGFNFTIPSSPRCSLGVPSGKQVNPLGCTYTSLTLAVMPKRASSFKQIGIIARPSFEYVPNVGKATGYFTNTNIYKNNDGYYYVITVDVLPDGSQRHCPIRTSDLSNPSTWRGWGGSDYNVDISKGADCADTGFSMFPFYLGYNAFFSKFIIVGAESGQIAYALSSDLVHWSPPVSIGFPIFDPQSDDWSNNNYPSLMDPSDLQRTQDGDASSGAVVGQKPWLVFIQHKKPQKTRILATPLNFSK